MTKIKLSFTKLTDGTCDIFADIFPSEANIMPLIAERAKFIQVKLYEQTSSRDTLLNIPYEDLKGFAKDILNA